MTRIIRAAFAVVAGVLVCGPLSGCLVAGYSSGGGWWVWPGSVLVTLVLVLGWLLARR